MADTAPGTGRDRRRDPRIDVSDGRIRATEVGAGFDVRLLNVSAGGFLVSTPVPYPIDAIREFVFAGRDPGVRVLLEAQAVFSDWDPGDFSHWPEYRTGFRFLNPENRQIAGRIEQLMAVALHR